MFHNSSDHTQSAKIVHERKRFDVSHLPGLVPVIANARADRLGERRHQDSFRRKAGAIGLELGRGIIGFDPPCPAVFEIKQQFLISAVSHVAGPDYLRPVDVSSVKDPVEVRAMVGTIVHDDQVFARHLLQFTHNRVPVYVSPLPKRFDLGSSRDCGDTKNDHR